MIVMLTPPLAGEASGFLDSSPFGLRMTDIRDGELGKFSGASGYEIQNDNRHPNTGIKPQSGKAFSIT